MTGTVVAQSAKMQHVLRQVHRLGRYRWPVLLLGETGTGKEVFARALHDVDPIGPFVTIDCSAMVGALMESELFGHARGAFTGAVVQKTGLIELANGGTAFFDEIGELPLEMQAKLLRVLQEKEYRQVGGTSHRRSEFRVIAATNRDLAREVERGTFRRDLYYRLNVVTLRLPALRDRMEDIPLLVDHFLDRFGKGHQLTQETRAVLVKYPWPGNVRELENCMKHMVSVNSGPYLHNADLPSMIQNHVSGERAHRMAAAAGGETRLTVVPALRPVEPVAAALHDSNAIVPLVELERREILRALNFTKGDRVMAASLLGIGRTTLYRKIKEYNVAV